jgi:hypothetical protein
MKKILALFSFLLVSGLLMNHETLAQKISLPSADFKKDMSGVFSPESDLDIDDSKKEELKSANSKFFDDILEVAGSNKSDEEKRKSILNLGKKQSGAFSDILGVNKAKQYKKAVKKKMRPFKTKYKLATLIL